jgi:hypothetical protein
MLRVFAFAASLTCAAVLAFAGSLLGAGLAMGEVISASFTTVATPYQVNLSDSTAFALWGTGTNGNTFANLTGGQEGLISPALQDFSNGNPTSGRGYASPPYWNYLVSGTQVYGAIHHLTQYYSPVGEGFNLYLHAGESETEFQVWMRSAGGTGSVTVTDFSTMDVWDVKALETNEYGYLSIRATDPLSTIVVSLRSTSGVAEYNGANVLLGGVTATVVAVPEPDYWLALLMLLGGVLAYATVGVVIWVREVLWALDEEQRDFEAKKRD